MRRKQIIPGFNNGQKFRFIVRHPNADGLTADYGMTLTIQQFFDQCATTLTRHAVTEGLVTLSVDRDAARTRHGGSGVPSGLVKRVTLQDHYARAIDLDVQIDLA